MCPIPPWCQGALLTHKPATRTYSWTQEGKRVCERKGQEGKHQRERESEHTTQNSKKPLRNETLKQLIPCLAAVWELAQGGYTSSWAEVATVSASVLANFPIAETKPNTHSLKKERFD